MEAVGWGMLLRPLIGICILVVVFGVPILLVRLLRPIFPNGRVKDALFRERGGESASARPDAEHRLLK